LTAGALGLAGVAGDEVVLGHGTAEAGADAVSPAGADAGADADAVPPAGADAGADADAVPPAGADAGADADAGAGVPAVPPAGADAEAQSDSADWLTLVLLLPPATAMMTPATTASATGMASGIATRDSRPSSRRRRHADRCLDGMQSTSMCEEISRSSTLPTRNSSHISEEAQEDYRNIRVSSAPEGIPGGS
jgi:hypothetical protein